MALTWQQVAAPNLTDVSRMLGQGAANAGEGLKSIAQAFDPIRDAAKVRRKELTDLNTLNEIQKIKSIGDVDALRQHLSGINTGQLTDSYGAGNIDLARVLSAADSAMPTLQNKITADQNYTQNQLKFNENSAYLDLSEQIKMAKDGTSLDALVPNISQLQSEYGSELAGMLDSKRKELLSASQATEDRANQNKLTGMRITAAERDLEKQDLAKEASAYYAELPTKLNQFGASPELMRDLESKPFYINATPEEQELHRKRLNSNVTLESSLLDANTKLKLTKENEQAVNQVQSTYKSIMTPIINREKKVQDTLSRYDDASGSIGVMGDLSDIAGIVKAADDDGKINTETVGEISEGITAIVDREQANLAEKYSKTDSTFYKSVLKSIPEETRKSMGAEAVNARIKLMAEQKAKEDINPRVIYKTIKDASFEDPWWGKIDLNTAAFENKLSQNAEEYSRLVQEQEQINEIKNTKESELNTTLSKQSDNLTKEILEAVKRKPK